MKIGVDFYGTVTKHPELFHKFLDCIDHEFWIISAVHSQNVKKLMNDVKLYHLTDYDIKIEPVIFVNYDEVPRLKLHTCQKIGIEMFIDDRLDTVTMMRDAGILALHVV